MIPYLCEVRETHVRTTCYFAPTDEILVNPREFTTDAQLTFALAHEMAHASGAAHRLGRRTILRGRHRLTCASTRVEEAIADAVAHALTGISRADIGIKGYPPVTPGTMRAHYVNVKVAEAIAYLQVMARVEGIL